MKRPVHIHFVGIGGIGMSALAKFYRTRGSAVSGSDIRDSEIVRELAAWHIPVRIGKHSKKNIPPAADLIIYSAAVPQINSELRAARAMKIPVLSYAEALGEITRVTDTITVSGSHGKSTTTALVSLVLEDGYFDPTVIVGTKLKEFGNSNFRNGAGKYLVLEADEWNRSFLNYSPQIAVLTNIDAEHLDTYKNFEEIKKAFVEFLGRVPSGGKIIANRDDQGVQDVARKFDKQVVWYSREMPGAHFVKSVLKISGDHNFSNALAALTIGRVLGVHEPAALHALGRFGGTWRRFDYRGMFRGAYLFDDYGHHPKEISATLQGARERFPFRRIWCVFQPHHYNRLKSLWGEFITAFDLADRICLLPVYAVAGRDQRTGDKKISSASLIKELKGRGKNAVYAHTFSDAKNILAEEVRKGDIVLMMGAGDIYTLTPQLLAIH